MPTTTPLTDAINALTRYASETTGAGDTNLSDAVATLVAGYGSGGSDRIEFSSGNIHALVFHSAIVTTDYTDNQDNIYAIKFKGGTSVNYEQFFGESTTGITARTGLQRSQKSNNSAVVMIRATNQTTYSINIDLTVDNVVIFGRPLYGGTVSTVMPMLIGGGYYQGNQESQKSNMTFYGLNIINANGEYVAKFMPWLENDTPCVKELVTGSLYYASAGSLGYIDKNGVTH